MNNAFFQGGGQTSHARFDRRAGAAGRVDPGHVNTHINYDMLDYLPADMDTVIGQNELLAEFGKCAFSLIVIEICPKGT